MLCRLLRRHGAISRSVRGNKRWFFTGVRWSEQEQLWRTTELCTICLKQQASLPITRIYPEETMQQIHREVEGVGKIIKRRSVMQSTQKKKKRTVRRGTAWNFFLNPQFALKIIIRIPHWFPFVTARANVNLAEGTTQNRETLSTVSKPGKRFENNKHTPSCL